MREIVKLLIAAVLYNKRIKSFVALEPFKPGGPQSVGGRKSIFG